MKKYIFLIVAVLSTQAFSFEKASRLLRNPRLLGFGRILVPGGLSTGSGYAADYHKQEMEHYILAAQRETGICPDYEFAAMLVKNAEKSKLKFYACTAICLASGGIALKRAIPLIKR